MLCPKQFFAPPFFRIFIPFGLTYFLAFFLSSANATMSPILITTFQLSPINLGFMSSVYLISFGVTQIPLGVMLDRHGAGKTLAPLLLFAVAGTIVFASAQGLPFLILSRMLLGIGLAGCLMSAFKGYADWLEQENLPLAYSLQAFMGGIGAMVATRPLAIAFEVQSWRVIFYVFAIVLGIVAAAVYFVVPQKTICKEHKQVSVLRQFFEMVRFLGDRRFWMIAPIAVVAEAVVFTYVFLWLGPWMRDVAMLPEAQAGRYLFLASGGVAAGYFFNGVLANLFKRKGWMSWESLYLLSGFLLTTLLLFVALGNPRVSVFLWPWAMFLATMAMIAFPLMRNMFEVNEVGRVLSLLNLAIFFMSFFLQWLVGAILEQFPVVGEHFSPQGYRVGLLVVVGFNAAAVIHFHILQKQRKTVL